jgi:predicted regulator of Ras-like GTPase activity (Roadblock/LC7/MglB family)
MASADRVIALEAALRRLGMIVDGVTASVIVSEDGFALAAYPDEEAGGGRGGSESAAQVAAVAASLAALAERSLDRLAQGELGRLLLEGEAGTLLSCPAGAVTLALLVEKEASMGHVLFAAQKAAAEIESILASQ